MFERFTDRARRVIVLAQAEARDHAHNYIGTEHLLLALAEEDGGIATQVLSALGFKKDEIASEVGQGDTPDPVGHIPFTPRSKKVLELALREALQLGHNYIGTEHLLLAVVRDGGGKAAEILGSDLQDVRQAVLKVLAEQADDARKKTLHIVGVREPDAQWELMKAVFDACVAARVDLPQVVATFFGSAGPDTSGMLTDLTDQVAGYTGMDSSGVELELNKLPVGITKLRVYLN